MSVALAFLLRLRYTLSLFFVFRVSFFLQIVLIGKSLHFLASNPWDNVDKVSIIKFRTISASWWWQSHDILSSSTVLHGHQSRQYRTMIKSMQIIGIKNCTIGDRSFAVAGPRIWNSLPPSIRDLTLSAGTFCNTVENLPVCLRAAALVFLNYSASEMYIMIWYDMIW